MRLFKCQVCAQLLYFENTRCEKCEHALGYEPVQNRLVALDPSEQSGEPSSQPLWTLAGRAGKSYKFCANAAHAACNWLIDAELNDDYCLACRHNGIIPDLGNPENAASWRKIEIAKHRLIYTLLRLNLPLQPRNENSEGLVFNFLADSPFNPNERIMTGHDSGTITLALAEADDVERERRRSQMGEPYRTLLGHFRHEVGHYFWNLLVRDTGGEASFVDMFGDHTRNYVEALQTYYAQGAPANWQDNFVSAYAAAHPWEDFAETWAHYLHIVDTIEMAGAFGIKVEPVLDDTGELDATIDFNPYRIKDFRSIIDAWLPLSFALNNINRSMGQPDLYPFMLSQPAIAKLTYIHGAVRDISISALMKQAWQSWQEPGPVPEKTS
jgi:hypothetical protein